MDGPGILLLSFGTGTFVLGVLVTVLFYDVRDSFSARSKASAAEAA